MSNEKKNTNVATNVAVADATPKIGKSHLVGFTYLQSGHCKVMLANGISGIIGKSKLYPFVALMALKGQKTELRYEYIGDTEPINNKVYKQYSLLWSVE